MEVNHVSTYLIFATARVVSPPAPGLTPATAGITLLALGNSAPDVFSDLAAVKNADDFALAIGELMGASMFLTTVRLAILPLIFRCTVAKYEHREMKCFTLRTEN